MVVVNLRAAEQPPIPSGPERIGGLVQGRCLAGLGKGPFLSRIETQVGYFRACWDEILDDQVVHGLRQGQRQMHLQLTLVA